ncbi:MAG: hypothetical protein ACT4P4_21340 [Betaproteobacteria bacterium]
MPGVLRRSLVFAVLLACAVPAHAAEPLVMFLLGIARDMAVKAIEERMSRPAPEPEVYGGTTVQPAHLRQLIHDSFLHLSQDQREEIFQALNAELVKPGSFSVRAAIIEYFSERALQVRIAHMQLAQLNSAQMQRLAFEFRREIQAMPDADLQQLRDTLQQGLLPVPPDLNRLLLAQFD